MCENYVQVSVTKLCTVEGATKKTFFLHEISNSVEKLPYVIVSKCANFVDLS